MRTDQPQGLPPIAEAFLAERETEPNHCEACARPFPRQLEIIGKYCGFDAYPLHRHQLKDGRTADEYLQATPWSSGPMFFLGLRLADGTEFAWSQEEIDQTN
jgi:hypothetical protein